MVIKVKPVNGVVRLPSGIRIDGSMEIQKTKEVARALRFNDLVIDTDASTAKSIAQTNFEAELPQIVEYVERKTIEEGE